MNDSLSSFVDSMREYGCGPADVSDIVADGEWHDYRIDTDPANKKKGYYRFKIDGDFAVGNFGDRRHGDTHKWHSKQKKTWTEEERQAWQKRVTEERLAREKEQEELHLAVSKACIEKWRSSKPVTTHPYLTKKGIKSYGLRQDDNGFLLVSGHDHERIYTLQSIDDNGEKLFTYQGRKTGCYFTIPGESKDRKAVIICEGYATGASIREATSLTVLCAFDCGNLVHVAKAARKTYPDAQIVIAADNDQYKERNAGKEKGAQAAAVCKGFLVLPEFKDTSTEPTDFNDLHTLEGLDAVKQTILSVLTPQTEAGVPEATPPASYVQGDSGHPISDPHGDFGLPFKVLGYNNGNFYYLPFRQNQIVKLTAGSHTMLNLLQLATIDEWESHESFMRLQLSKIPIYAGNMLMQLATERGVFAEEDRVRGAGIWMDAGRVIVHCGDKLIVDGMQKSFKEVTSHYVYTSAQRMLVPGKEPLRDDESQMLYKICSMPTWENPLSAVLLSGWMVVAPVCAALKWRPHIWVTGAAESGKSTIMGIIKRVLGDVSLNVDATSSEPSIRERMGYNARPIVFDEADNAKSMEAILFLARLSSSGGTVVKHGQNPFKAVSCFCFAGINPPVKDFADETRISMMSIRKNTSAEAKKHYEDLVHLVEEWMTPEYSRRLLKRTIDNLPTLITNIATFKSAARTVIKGARASEHIGTMLAGAHLLKNTSLISEEDAIKIIQAHQWEDHTAIAKATDSERLLHHISTSIIRITPPSGNSRDITIGELIMCAMSIDGEVTAPQAKSTLAQYSISPSENGVCIGDKNHNLSKLLKDTDWVINWRNTLKVFPGAKPYSKKYFSAGDQQNAICIPLSFFKPTEQPAFEEIPF